MGTTFLDNRNFKIESKDWKIQEAIGVIHGKKSSIKVKVNAEGDVREYVSGMPASFVGQQLFTYAAALRETAKAKMSLPENQDELHRAINIMPGETEHQKYKNYLIKIDVQLAGCYSSGLYLFDDIGVWAYYRLADGSRLNLNHSTWSSARRDETMGYSIRTN